MGEAIDARARGMVGGRSNDQHLALLAVVVQSPPTANDAVAVLPQGLRAAVRVRAVQRMQHHPSAPASASGLRARRPSLTGATRPQPLSAPAEIVPAWPDKCQRRTER